MKTATTIDEQIQLLEERGLKIRDITKAKEILEDIGYYRLGFYLFPFEQTYPRLKERTHDFVEGFTFDDAVNLYYFDYDLRLILMRYLIRIEIHFRTKMIHTLSNKYNQDPTWFINPDIVSPEYINSFDKKVYTPEFRRNPIIHRHHSSHKGDKYAPAWKTLEFMTFGAIMKLYEQLQCKEDKIDMAQKFGVRQVKTFENYMHTIRQVRNACAHGLLLYDLRLPLAIRKGPAGNDQNERTNIIGALRIIRFIMTRISENRALDLSKEVRTLYNNLCVSSNQIKPLMPDFSTI